MIFLLAQGTGRAVYQTFVSVVTTLRNQITITDDPTPTAGPSPTVRIPPPPPQFTPLPATPTVIAMCTIPDLTNYQYNAAVAEWQNYGFKSGTLTKPASASSTFIIGSQSLLAGVTMRCDTTSMSVGPKQCQVPDLEGQVFSAARDGAWASNEFIKANLLHPSDTDETFTIGSQQFSSGTMMDCEATMLVEPQRCTVPNLVGKVFNTSGTGTANDAWENQGFGLSRLTKDAAAPTSFTVASQSLASGTIIYCQTGSMEVSPPMCTVPDLVGTQYSGAQTLWTNRGFTTSLAKASGTPSDFTISSQTIAAGEQRSCAGTTMTVQPNMCTVPNMVGKTITVAAAEWKQAPNNFTSDLSQPATVSGNFTIAQQLTAAGTVIACSSTVYVQPAMCTVPNMVNKTFSQATSAWSSANFTGALQNPLSMASGTTVKSQQYTASESRACADTMWVKPALCTVPDMSGQLFDSVKDNGEAFKNAGFTSTLANAWGDTSNRRIGSSNPGADTEMSCAGTVTVSEGMCTVPNLDGQMYDDVSGNGEAFKNAGFTSTLGRDWGTTNRRIGTTSPAAGSQVLCSATVTASEKLCTVPNLNGITSSAAEATNGAWKQAGFTGSLNETHGTNTTTALGWQQYSAGTARVCSSSMDVAKVCLVPDLINVTWGTATGNSGPWKARGFTTSNLKAYSPTSISSSNPLLWQEFTEGTKLFCDAQMKVSKNSNPATPNPASATPLP